MKDSLRKGTDNAGVVSMIAILFLVIIAGFIAYRVFATPAGYGTDAPASDLNSAPTTSSTGASAATTTE